MVAKSPSSHLQLLLPEAMGSSSCSSASLNLAAQKPLAPLPGVAIMTQILRPCSNYLSTSLCNKRKLFQVSGQQTQSPGKDQGLTHSLLSCWG